MEEGGREESLKTYFLIYSLDGTVKGGAILQMGNMFDGEENEFFLDMLSLSSLYDNKEETPRTKIDEDAWSSEERAEPEI